MVTRAKEAPARARGHLCPVANSQADRPFAVDSIGTHAKNFRLSAGKHVRVELPTRAATTPPAPKASSPKALRRRRSRLDYQSRAPPQRSAGAAPSTRTPWPAGLCSGTPPPDAAALRPSPEESRPPIRQARPVGTRYRLEDVAIGGLDATPQFRPLRLRTRYRSLLCIFSSAGRADTRRRFRGPLSAALFRQPAQRAGSEIIGLAEAGHKPPTSDSQLAK